MNASFEAAIWDDVCIYMQAPEPDAIIARGIYMVTEQLDAHGRLDGAELHRIDAESQGSIALNRHQYENLKRAPYFERR